MTTYIVITHDVDQIGYKNFLTRLDCKISTDYSAMPTMYKIEAGHKAIDTIRKDRRTMSVHIADSKVRKHFQDEVGLKVRQCQMVEEFKRSESNIQILDIDRQRDNWGLGRIDQRDAIVPVDETKANLAKFNDRVNTYEQVFYNPAVNPSDGTLVYEYSKTGVNIDVYVIDSGIRKDHVDFSGRVNELWSAFGYFDDDGGHGTHVASTIGGERFGVAKDVTIHNIKVFGPDDVITTLSMIIDAMNEVLKHHQNKVKNKINRGSVVNMSLTGSSSALSIVASELKKNGIIVVVAAGNESANLDTSFNAYPAESPDVITVVSSNNIDRPSYFNNYGDAVDVFAPGGAILAAGHHATNGTTIMSGTSMATPHVAGVVALALEGKEILSTEVQAQQAMDLILNTSSLDKIIFDRDFSSVSHLFKNKLIFSRLAEVNIDDPVVTPLPDAPVVAPLPDAPEEGSNKIFIVVGGLIAIIGVVFALLS